MKIFWFDTETSGLSPKENGIISLAYAVEVDGEFKEHGELFSNCRDKKIDDGALSVNGFTREEIKNFPDPEELYKSLAAIFAKYVNKYDRLDKFTAGGYNVSFDLDFLRQLFLDNGDQYFGSWFGYGVIDPAQIIRFLQYCGYEFPVKAKLVDIASTLGIETEGAHDAMADIGMTIRVVKGLKKYIA